MELSSDAPEKNPQWPGIDPGTLVSIQGMDKLIETLDSIGMKLLAAQKEY